MRYRGPAQAFFGGSFDPVHNGHLHVARTVREETTYKTILFVPNRANPLKDGGAVASAHHRYRMVLEAIREMEWCAASSVEIDTPAPSYTVDTITALIERGELIERPGMIIGDDLLEQLPRWHDAAELLTRVVLILLRRETGDSPAAPSDLPAGTITVQNKRCELSSTDIRRRLQLRKPIRGLVPEQVYEYIQRHHPYQ